MIRRLSLTTASMIVAGLLLTTGLYLLSRSTQSSATFDRLHVWLLVFNAVAALVLLALIGTHLVKLITQYRRRAPGARLTARLVIMFVVLALLPVGLVYYFSVQFIDRSIDSWFDVRVEAALGDAVTLSRRALEVRKSELLARTRYLAVRLASVSPNSYTRAIAVLRGRSGAAELTLFSTDNRIIANSRSGSDVPKPVPPTRDTAAALHHGNSNVILEPIGKTGLRIRAITPVPVLGPLGLASKRYLQAIYRINPREGGLAQSVETAYTRYNQALYLRKSLKYSLILTLSLVLLLGLLAAVWGAFYAARRLIQPIQNLAEGTRAVARGDFTQRLPIRARDEVGFLVSSFNEMTRRLGQARDLADRSQQQVESERSYLEAILARLSSGVIVLDSGLTLRVANTAAATLLGLDVARFIDLPLSNAMDNDFVARFLELFEHHSVTRTRHWRDELVIGSPSGRRLLSCSCTSLPNMRDNKAGYVVVFDELTELVQAQRDAAWGEVARRLAHEIKNPLTPIQLAAERLQQRYVKRLSGKDAEIFERSTQTIVQQVETMKAMVNAFSDYARTPALELQRLDLNRLVAELAELYAGSAQPYHLRLALDPSLPMVRVDPGRMGQLLHNLIRNAGEALEGRDGAEIVISTQRLQDTLTDSVELTVTDNGPGVDPAFIDHVFEPYVTSKHKGTGLGLAIVKKMAEEHGGTVRADNGTAGGVSMRVRLPVNERALVRSLLGVADREQQGES